MTAPAATALDALWWAGDLVWAVIVIPVVLLLLAMLIRRALRIYRYVNEMAARSDLAVEHLEALRDMATMPELVDDAGIGLTRYRTAMALLRGRKP